MGSKKKSVTGYRYYMGLHFGLCHGPVDEVQQVKVGDREAWAGSVTDNATISINAPSLFGGDKKEGGIVGSLDLAMGGAAQTANSYLASKIGATIPAFRGIFSAVWKGGQVSANNPYIKPWAFRVKRILQGWYGGAAWYPEKAVLFNASQSTVAETYTETFSDFPSAYTDADLVAETALRVSTPYGNGLRVICDAHTGTGIFFRTITSARYSRIRYYVNADNQADVPGLSRPNIGNIFFRNTNGGSTITLRTANASTSDRFTCNGVAVSSTPLPSGIWYLVTVDLDWVAGVGACVVTRASDASAFGSCAFSFATTYAISGIGSDVDYETGYQSGESATFAQVIMDVITSINQWDMNPAHIIYQCLTDGVWGMGYPISAIDNDSFSAAADKLYSESFGLSMIWNKQDTIESFIKIVLDHAGGILYVDPSSGKFALKLIRDDYVKASLPIYGPSNLISASDYQRQSWGETVNEISVVYTDAFNGKDVSVTVQDLANIQTQGGVVAQAKQYPGIKSALLAQRVAMRDLIVTSTPLAKIKLTATRKAWSVIPGDVIRLTWPEYGIEDVVYRILEVNRGTLHNGEITIEAVEDVFGMPTNTYVADQGSGWVEPSTPPAAATYRKLIETPYWDLARSLSAADLDYTDPLSGYLETLAVRPSGDSMDYEINTKTGSADYAERATGQFCPAATLTVSLTKTTTSITFDNMMDVELVETGGYAIIDDEYVGITAIDAEAGTATITRGVLDTVPDEHSIGARVWFADDFQGVDETEYADGETVDCKILPRTGQGELDIIAAPADSLTMDQRHNRPYPPGKVLVNGSAYPDWIGGTSALELSWAHRDRLLQTAYLVEQSEASIGPELGTTYTVRVYDQADTLAETATGISGTSYNYTSGLSGDTYFASVSLLMHMDGVDNGTVFTDVKGKTVTRFGNTVTKTAVKKYGTASAYFDGAGDYLTVPNSTDFEFGASDFTIEAWIRPASLADWRTIVSKNPADTAGVWRLLVGDSGKIAFGFYNGTTWRAITVNAAGILVNQWHHIAATRHGNDIRLFVDGVQKGATLSTTDPVPSLSNAISIGRVENTWFFDGHIDDLRITKGVARYTEAFTPPAQAHPDELGTASSGLLRFELESVRDGLASYQAHNHEVRRTGYGFNYGMYYG